uniref:AMP-dependent synthetase/ligase domain-containing protein n=1 Tax=Kwoniella bestiolae CBS 10118 TaxID=1296100 RepID=A0A1B9GAM9_9TREE|nr:hypothetical protein I302_02934 [Kwoniella bestiolae CBS 10118]OCF28083.1 hypothetical protein I302_02934 [Kwoniella bestiolae CBS 10118]
MFWRNKSASVPLKADPSVRRSHLSPNELVTRPAGDEVTVVGDFFPYCAKKYGDQIACYYRDVVDVVEETKMVPRSDGSGEEKKIWKYFTLSTPKPVTYTELNSTVTSLASGLINIGFTVPSQSIASRPRVSIYADTSLNWQLMSQTFARLGHVLTTAYTTLGEDGLLTSLNEPEVELCYCGEGQVELIGKVIDEAQKVRWIVYDGDEKRINQVVEGRGGRIVTLNQLKQTGIESPVADFGDEPSEDDLFCIMYTSGSTGIPKGVLLTHKNIISSIAGSVLLWGKDFKRSDLLLAYLPLTHILEQFLEFTLYFLGIPIAYGTVKTLLNDNVRNCDGDFVAYKPTLLPGVPAIYEMIRKGMVKKIHDAGSVVGTIFNLAVSGKQTLPWPFSSAIDRILFAKVKAATGGRLRLAISGGGALSLDTQKFLSTVLVNLIQGYGLTETCGMATICTPQYSSMGSVGVIGPSCEVKLQADYPDAGYFSTNKHPQGEILLRGPNVFKGYLKQEDLTRESFTSDGWYKTGDIGQWNEDGTLSVIDRVKNLVKLANGEYLALEKVESVYKHCNSVMMLCVVAPPGADRPVALVYPHEGNLRNRLKANGIVDDGGPKEWASNLTIVSYLLGELRDEAKRGGLKGSELIRDVIMTEEEWSPENGMLTPAMKLARNSISKKYEKEIEKALGRSA